MTCSHRNRTSTTARVGDRRVTTFTCQDCPKTFSRSKKLTTQKTVATSNSIQKAKAKSLEAQERALTVKRTKTADKGKDAPRAKCVRKKAMRKVSDKRSAENRKYLKLRREFLAEHQYCQVCWHNFSNEVHHSAGREGPWLLKVEFWYALCGTCHQRVHDHPEWAKEHGFLKLRLTTDQLDSRT